MKYTANTRKTKPIIWFSRNVSVLKKSKEKSRNTIRVMTSWMTFNSTKEKGPPFCLKPIRLAGTWKKYSKSAIPQLINIMDTNVRFSNHFMSLNFKWPYQATVIKVLESTSRPIV